MNRERAETHLRGLAEAELRRATSQPWGDAQRAGYADRVTRVAQVLVFVGALDERAADQILDDFELAHGARQAGQGASVAGWSTRRAEGRTRPARGVGAPAAAAGGSAAVRSRTGIAARRMYAPIPLGHMVRVRGADVDGEVCLLFDPFTATDDRGTSYQVTIRDIGSPVLGWTLVLHPDPQHDPQWLDLATTGEGPAARIILPAAAGQPDTIQPRRAPAEHDRGPAAGGRAAPPARPLAVRDRAAAQAATRHHRRTR